jgi:hypothetical protein
MRQRASLVIAISALSAIALVTTVVTTAVLGFYVGTRSGAWGALVLLGACVAGKLLGGLADYAIVSEAHTNDSWGRPRKSPSCCPPSSTVRGSVSPSQSWRTSPLLHRSPAPLCTLPVRSDETVHGSRSSVSSVNSSKTSTRAHGANRPLGTRCRSRTTAGRLTNPTRGTARRSHRARATRTHP